ncbi:MAG: energy transducer TonB [Bacteroidetes bacterium]|nr:energy transducer TonB [Bacteroidota bacterium]
MKTKGILRFFLVVSVAGLFMFQPVLASTPANDCATALWKKFQSTIKYPEFAHEHAIQGEVTVLFTVSEDGEIVVKDVRANDADLAKYIREVITTVKCPELDNAEIYDFKVHFHFRLI